MNPQQQAALLDLTASLIKEAEQRRADIDHWSGSSDGELRRYCDEIARPRLAKLDMQIALLSAFLAIVSDVTATVNSLEFAADCLRNEHATELRRIATVLSQQIVAQIPAPPPERAPL